MDLTSGDYFSTFAQSYWMRGVVVSPFWKIFLTPNIDQPIANTEPLNYENTVTGHL